jgi:hypothetical protein
MWETTTSKLGMDKFVIDIKPSIAKNTITIMTITVCRTIAKIVK